MKEEPPHGLGLRMKEEPPHGLGLRMKEEPPHGLCMQKKKNMGRALGSWPGDPDGGGVMQRTSGARVARGTESGVTLLHAAAATMHRRMPPSEKSRFIALS
jgi:hypothetical protein